MGDNCRQRTVVYPVYKNNDLGEENIELFKKHHILPVHLTVRSARSR